MRIAFTSCFDAEDDPLQLVWDRIHALEPDVLLLLGDSVYLDFGVKFLGADRPLGSPQNKSDAEFARFLYGLYALQWGVTSFRRLVRSGVRLGMTWDDHDFAWNNSRGAGKTKKHAVPLAKRLISRGLFTQFRNALETLAFDSPYPECPSLEALLAQPDSGIQYYFDKDGVRFVLLDGRTFRQDPLNEPGSLMHGPDQLEWLFGLLAEGPGIKLVGSGSVLQGTDEAWDKYLDYEWFLSKAPGNVVVLTGDIHKNKPPRNHRPLGLPLYEITASGAARPGPLKNKPGLLGASGNVGILTVSQDAVSATLYSAAGNAGPYPLVF